MKKKEFKVLQNSSQKNKVFQIKTNKKLFFKTIFYFINILTKLILS